MPTPKKGARLGGSPAHQRLILANLATALFEHGRITTTETKARVLRPVAEKLITKAKKGDLHNRREVLKTIRDKSVVHTLFTEIAPTFAERPGGYTRITKIGPRKGDNAPMAVIELVTESYTPSAPKQRSADQEGRCRGSLHRPPRSRSRPRTRPAEVEATDEAGETEVVETEAADVETAEAQSEAEARGAGCRGAERPRRPRTTPRPDPHADHADDGASVHSGAPWRPSCVLSDSRWAPGDRRGEVGVHQGYDAGALARRGGDALHRPGPDVAGREEPGDRRWPGWPGGSPSDHRSLGTSRPVSTKPCSSRQTSSGSQSHCGSAPSSRNSPPASCRVTSPVFRSRIPTHSSRPSPPPSTTSAHSRTLIWGTYFISRIR